MRSGCVNVVYLCAQVHALLVFQGVTSFSQAVGGNAAFSLFFKTLMFLLSQ